VYRSRYLLTAVFFSLGLAGCGGGSGSPPVAPVAAPQAAERTIDATLSSTPRTYMLPLSGGYDASLSMHADGVAAGTRISLGVRQPEAYAANERSPMWHHPSACPLTFTIPLFNPLPFAIKLQIDGFSAHLPCVLSNTLFGVSFYQLHPVPSTVTSEKLGDITASGQSILFTSDDIKITLPAHTETAISIIPEDSTSEVGIPIIPGSSAVLTANAPALPQSLAINYQSSGGGGSLYSSACFPAIVSGKLAQALQGVPILGTATLYCQLGTVNSATVLFGAPTVTFTVGSPKPDRSFTELDGPVNEYLCSVSGPTTCVTPEFTVPVVQNVIVGNVQDLQACVPLNSEDDCNTNGNPSATPAPSVDSVNAHQGITLLVADDPTFVAPAGTGSCSAPAVCGGFTVDTSAGQCTINENADEHENVPTSPHYNNPGGPQQDPPVTSGGIATRVFYPKQGPYVEFDLISAGSGSTCSVTVSEADGPLLRTITLNLPVH